MQAWFAAAVAHIDEDAHDARSRNTCTKNRRRVLVSLAFS
jgi:hypothetical protein